MEEIITIKKYFKPFYRKKTEGGHDQLALPAPPNEGVLNIEELGLIGLLLTKEEPIVELEPKHEDEEEYQVEEPWTRNPKEQMRTMTTKEILSQKSTLMKSTHEVKGHLRA